MHGNIQKRLLRVEDELLSAISAGVSQLESYDDMWAALLHDIQHASSREELPNDTVILAHSVASHVLAVAECFANFENKYRDLTLDLHGDLEQLATGFSDVHLTAEAGSPAEDRNYLSQPSFIRAAYRWLLDNLHNPYPSVEVKKSIAHATGCSLPSVSAWFTSARRRMGWTTICRDYFRNCRADAVDAAYRALVKQDPNQSLSPCYVQAFMEMKVNAEGLYSSTFTPSALAGTLDAVVQDMTEESKGGARKKAGGKSLPKASCTRETETTLALRSYSSPGSSRATSPALSILESPTDQRDVEDDITLSILAGKKRRCSGSIESDDQGTKMGRPAKRARVCSGSSSTLIDDSIDLPSPCSSTVNDQLNDLELIVRPHSPSPRHSPCLPRVPSRKRRLSSSDLDRWDTPRRPYAAPTGAREHVVSDPIPKPTRTSEGVDDWFNINFTTCFDVPPPVEFADIDSTFPWEIKFFDAYSIPMEQTTQDCHVQDLCHDTSKSLDVFRLDDSPSGIENYLPGLSVPSVHFMTQEVTASPQLKDLASTISLPTEWTDLLNSDFHGETTALNQNCGLDPTILQLSSFLCSEGYVQGNGIVSG